MRSLGIAAMLMLSACTVGPDYRAPKPLAALAADLTEAGQVAAVTAQKPRGDWWRLFESPDLDKLVEKALTYNSDVRIASANLQRARALLLEAGAGRLPITDVTANATRGRSAPTARRAPARCRGSSA